MSVTFTKLFSSITESTVWSEPDRTRLVWITMLAMADRKGRVWSSIPGLANRARVPLGDAETALQTFLSPDKYSRTTDFEGRRIEAIDGGWRLLNYDKYRATRDDDTRREQVRSAVAKHRANVSQCKPDVSHGKPIAEAEAEAEAEVRKKKKEPPLPPKGKLASIDLPDWLPLDIWNAYLDMRKSLKRPLAAQGQALAIKKLDTLRVAGHDITAILEQSVFHSWQGLFAPKENANGQPEERSSNPRTSTSDHPKPPGKYAHLGEVFDRGGED